MSAINYLNHLTTHRLSVDSSVNGGHGFNSSDSSWSSARTAPSPDMKGPYRPGPTQAAMSTRAYRSESSGRLPSPEQLVQADYSQSHHGVGKLSLSNHWASLAAQAAAAQPSEPRFLLPFNPATSFEIAPGVFPAKLINTAALATGIPSAALLELGANLSLLPFAGLASIKAVKPLHDLSVGYVRNLGLNGLSARSIQLRKHADRIFNSNDLSINQKIEMLQDMVTEEKLLLRHNEKDTFEVRGRADTPSKKLALAERESRRTYHSTSIAALSSMLDRLSSAEQPTARKTLKRATLR